MMVRSVGFQGRYFCSSPEKVPSLVNKHKHAVVVSSPFTAMADTKPDRTMVVLTNDADTPHAIVFNTLYSAVDYKAGRLGEELRKVFYRGKEGFHSVDEYPGLVKYYEDFTDRLAAL